MVVKVREVKAGMLRIWTRNCYERGRYSQCSRENSKMRTMIPQTEILLDILAVVC